MNIAVIKGDIVGSRKVQNPELWMQPLKQLLERLGSFPQDWELIWGDSFQLQLSNASEALQTAVLLKSLIKSLPEDIDTNTKDFLDVRMGIGIGELTYQADRISESNGPAFVLASKAFDNIQKGKSLMMMASSDERINQEINLYLRLAGKFMDNWSISSAELVHQHILHPNMNQDEHAERFGISQGAVSARKARSGLDEILAIDEVYKQRIRQIL